MARSGLVYLLSGLFLVMGLTAAVLVLAGQQGPKFPIYEHWDTYGVHDGLPSEKCFSVRMQGERVWVGTDNGLACLENGRWRTYTTKDGLAHRACLWIAVSPETEDVWIGTMGGGLCRYSAGRFDTFNQFNSGLPNDVVFAVACQEEYVWTATPAGVGRYNTRTDQWSIWDQNNAPMHEPWCYHVSWSPDNRMIYVTAWGGGVLEYHVDTGEWKDYRDPDGEFEIDLFPNDGLVQMIATAASYDDGMMWASSYFGINSYDYRHWNTYYQDDSGLASDFVNMLEAHGPACYCATDKGMSVFDGTYWATYKALPSHRGETLVYRGARLLERRETPTGIAHSYVFNLDAEDNEVWVATARGVSHARVEKGR